MYKKYYLLVTLVMLSLGSFYAHAGKIQVESEDGKFSARLGGRFMYDTAFYFNDESELDNGSEIRRARLFLSGNLWGESLGYKFQYDFISQETGPARGGQRRNADIGEGIRDAYLVWNGKPFSVKAGHSKHPGSLEDLTSSKYVTFMERALPTVFYSEFSRRIGLLASYNKDGLGASLGAYFADADQDGADDGSSYAGRVFYNVLHGKSDSMILHLGANISYREYDDYTTIRIRQRPESHVTNVRFVDTGGISGVDNISLYGVEAALVHGRLAMKGQYMTLGFDRRAAADPDFSGYFVEASWFLTDDSLNYSKGSFKAVKPGSLLSNGGTGAWQVAVRYSGIDLSDSGISGGEQENITLGVNAYLTPVIRIAADYVNVLDVDGGGKDGDQPSLLQFRVQLEF